MPLRSALAAAIAAFLFPAKTVPPEAVAGWRWPARTPSARSATFVTVTVGPNVSSVTALLSSGTSARMTGPTNGRADARHAADDGAPATGERVRDVLLDDIDLAGHGHRPVVGLAVVAGTDLGDPFGKFLEERVVDVLRHVDALDPDAGLPAVGQGAPGGRVRRGIEVRVGGRR